jgi:dTDP-4-dehydrorhamnose reductase
LTRVLVLGGAGMLGHKLCQVLGTKFETYATFRGAPPAVPGVYDRINALAGIDASDVDIVGSTVRRVRPAFVLNAIGLVKQRSDASDPIQAISVNSLFPHQVAAICRTENARLIHISTDCVFSGSRGGYTEDDVPDPIDLYGRSKLLGEIDAEHVLTLRTSIIGRELGPGLGLVEWFLSNAGGRVGGYRHAIYSGMTTRALSLILASVMDSDVPLSGIWHVSAPSITKLDLLRQINEAFGANTTIDVDDTFRSDRSLVSDRFWAVTGIARPTWHTMIREMAEDTTPYRQRGGATTVH